MILKGKVMKINLRYNILIVSCLYLLVFGVLYPFNRGVFGEDVLVS